MNRLLCKSILFALFLFAGTVAPGGQATPKSARDVFEITQSDISDAKKTSKYKSLIDIQSAVLLSELNDDVVYIEIKVHNKSKQDIEIWPKDIRATIVVSIVGADGMTIAHGTPGILELFGHRLPMMIKPGENAMFLLIVKHIEQRKRFNIAVSLFDLNEEINLKKK